MARGTTEQMVEDAFNKVGSVRSVTLVRNRITGETRGFGFVEFRDRESMYRALDMDDPPMFRDRVTGTMWVAGLIIIIIIVVVVVVVVVEVLTK